MPPIGSPMSRSARRASNRLADSRNLLIQNQSERTFKTMLDTAGLSNKLDEWLKQDTDDKYILKTDGTWYHFAVTYAGTDAGTNNMLRKIYMNGQQIWGTGVSDPTNKGNAGCRRRLLIIECILSF